MIKKIKKLRQKFLKYNIDGYIVPKNDEFFSEYVTYDRGSDDDFVRLWQIKGSTQTGSAHKSTPDFGDHWQLGDQCSKNVSGCAKRFRTSFATIDGSVRKTITEKDEMLPFGGFPGTKTRA